METHKKRYSLKKIGMVVIILLVILAFYQVTEKRYANPINHIESIQYENHKGEIAYRGLDMTIESYWALQEKLVVSFMFEDRKASIALDISQIDHTLTFQRLDESSDHFIYALCKLYQEDKIYQKIKEETVFEFWPKGGDPRVDLSNKGNRYAIDYVPQHDHEQRCQYQMTIDLDAGKIELWEKYGGITKTGFVEALGRE